MGQSVRGCVGLSCSLGLNHDTSTGDTGVYFHFHKMFKDYQGQGGSAGVEKSIQRGQCAGHVSAQGPANSPPKGVLTFSFTNVNFSKETKVWKIDCVRMCAWIQ